MRMALATEKKLLQATILLGCLVPLIAGASGIVLGLHDGANPGLDDHFRYLSGLLLGIGLSFIYMTPRVELHSDRFLLLTAIIFIGGLSRLCGVFLIGRFTADMGLALGMELVVTPLLCFWQHALARRYITSVHHGEKVK